MTNSPSKQRAGSACIILVFTLLLVLIPSFIFDFYYDLNDDTMIKDIISGAYTGTPSGYSIQMLYPLSWFIALFYRAIPALPWYGLFLCMCQFGVIVLIGLRLMKLLKTTLSRIISLVVLLFLVLGMFIREFVIIQYSVTSAVCMVGAIFLFATSDQDVKGSEFIKNNISSVILTILSFMIRTEMCLMLMPFLFLIGIFKWSKEKEVFAAVNFRKYLALIGIALIGMLAMYSLDLVAYSGSEWTSFREFFDARTKLYDFYELPGYDDNKDFYDSIGLSRESYTLLENYNFALDESIDSWMLKSISDYQKQNAGVTNNLSNTLGFVSKNNIKEAIWLYKNHLIEVVLRLTDGAYLEYMVAFLYVICIMFASLRKPSDRYCVNMIEIFSLMFVRSALWLYLYMVDRVLDRVTIPLIMAEMNLLMVFILGSLRIEIGKRLRFIIGLIFIMVPTLLATESWNSINNEMVLRTKADARWNALMEYCTENSDNYYVIDVYSSTSYNGANYSEKIFKNVDNSYKNYDICGGWMAKSPLMREKLSVMGLKYIQSAIYLKKAYFIVACDKDITWLTRYYQNRSYNVAPICIDYIYTDNNEAAFMVYTLEERH